MDGAASEAVRGLKAEQDSDLATIWEALARRFGFVDEPQRTMRHFDVRKQLDGESLAVFEQGLRTLLGEAWPGVDLKSPDADSRLRRKFVDGLICVFTLRLMTFPLPWRRLGSTRTRISSVGLLKSPPFVRRLVRRPSRIIRWIQQPRPSWTRSRHIYWETEAARRRSIQPRCLTPTPTQDPRARGLLPARDRWHLAMHLQEAPPVVSHLMAAPLGSKTR